MMSTRTRAGRGATGPVYALFALLAATAATAPRDAQAGSKDACVDAHSRGQDLRDRGQLTAARQAFMSCAQSSCPSLIQGDCAKFTDEVERLLPSVSFAARDEKGEDLPATSVYVDGQLTTMRLDDGRSFELDPGKHTMRFVHDARELTLDVVLNQGEKGRTILAKFPSPEEATAKSSPAKPPPEPKRPTFPLVVAGLGAATMVAGGTFVGLGMAKMPSNCSMSSHDCAAAPGDKSFDEAHSATSMINLGIGAGVGGAAILVSGLVWYFSNAPKLPNQEQSALRVVQPWVGQRSGGVSFGSTF